MTSPDPSSSPTRPVLLVFGRDGARPARAWSELTGSFDLTFVSNQDELLAEVGRREVALVILEDIEPTEAFALRDAVAAAGRGEPFAMLTSRAGEDEAVEALRRGFSDYVVKRGDAPRADLLARRLERSLELARLKRENETLHRAIQDSQARLFSVYDSLDDAIMQIDTDCRVQSLNRSAAALANTEPRDAAGKVCWQLFDFHPCDERRKKESCHIYRTFIEGETIRGEREDPKTKETHTFKTFITTLRDKDYVVYRETDITEKRRLEDKIAAALRSLGADPDLPEDR